MIDAVHARIAVDDRHCDVRLALTEDVSERMFPEWAMLDDDMPSMTWSPEEVAGGAVEKASPEDLRAIFEGIAEKARS